MKNKEQAADAAGIQLGVNALKQIPRGDKDVIEYHLTGVLIVFLGALRGTCGDEFARGFIEAQLRSMEPGVPCDKFMEPTMQ